jgi:shikimate dehydrogenase
MLGHPVAGNPTQFMFEKAFAHHELDWRYLSLDVLPEDLANAVRGMRAMGFHGGNCAEPHKRTVLLHLDRNSEAAELSGSVNCILRQDRQLLGENTEGKSLLAAVLRRIDPAGKRVVILGAGHVARAIGVELAWAQAGPVTVVNRSEPAGRQFAELLTNRLRASASFTPWEGDFQVPPETDLLIHATTLGGGESDRVPVVLDQLRPDALVADVIQNPPRTRLLREAQEHGCPTIDGLELFVGQSAISFKLWTGIELDTTVMSEAVEEFLGV